MSRKILTANRLIDGAVVYRGTDGHWSTRIEAAESAADETAAKALLATGEADTARRIVVAPYLIEVEGEPGAWRLTSWRERIRAGGPTVPHDFAPAAEPRRAANGSR